MNDASIQKLMIATARDPSYLPVHDRKIVEGATNTAILRAWQKGEQVIVYGQRSVDGKTVAARALEVGAIGDLGSLKAAVVSAAGLPAEIANAA